MPLSSEGENKKVVCEKFEKLLISHLISYDKRITTTQGWIRWH